MGSENYRTWRWRAGCCHAWPWWSLHCASSLTKQSCLRAQPPLCSSFQEALSTMEDGNSRPIRFYHYIAFMQEASNPPNGLWTWYRNAHCKRVRLSGSLMSKHVCRFKVRFQLYLLEPQSNLKGADNLEYLIPRKCPEGNRAQGQNFSIGSSGF